MEALDRGVVLREEEIVYKEALTVARGSRRVPREQ